MKWILAILLFISASAIGQSDDTDKYIWYKFQYGSRMPRFWADSVLKAAGLIKFTGLASTVDTTNFKPLGINSSGDVRKLPGWPGGGGPDRLSAKAYYLTKEGGVSDADITMHSTLDGTDNTTVIKNILDQASATQAIELIVDGRFSADSIRIKSNTTITILEGGGLIQRSGINTSFIANYNRTSGSITDSNIVIRGGIINGHGHDADGSENRTYYGWSGWNTVVNIRGVKNLTIQNCKLINGRTFIGYISNADNVLVENCSFDQSPSIPMASPPNITFKLIHDGIKIGGPSNNIRFLNNDGYTIDDIISLCPNDGFFPNDTTLIGLNVHDAYASYGNVTNCKIDGLHFKNGFHGIRFLTASDSLKNIIVQNITGTVHENLAIIDNYPGLAYTHGSYTDGYADKITLDNVNVKVIPNTVDNSTNNAGIYFSCAATSVNLNNINYSGYQSGYPLFKQGSFNINTLTLDDIDAGVRPVANAISTTNVTNLRGSVYNHHESGMVLFDYTGTNRSTVTMNNSGVDNLGSILMRPLVAGNVGMGLSIYPIGTGQSPSFKSQFELGNSDLVDVSTNGEELLLRATGATGFGFTPLAWGTGARRNIWFDMTGNVDPNQASFTLGANSQVGINNPTPTHKLDIINSGSGGSTGWGLRITGSSSSGPGIVLKNNDNSKNWLITNGQTTATDGTLVIYDSENSAARLTINGSTGTVAITGDATVADEAYDATAWNGSTEVPTKNAIRDKIESMGGSSYTFTNGLTESGGTVKLGDTLTENTTITSAVSGRNINYTGVSDYLDGPQFSVTNSGSSGIAIHGESTGGRGIEGVATSGVGVYALASSGNALIGLTTSGSAIYAQSDDGMLLEGTILPSSTNTSAQWGLFTRKTTGTAANGLGGHFEYKLQSSTGADRFAASMHIDWEDATDATRSSRIYFNNTFGTVLTLNGNGGVKLGGYGSGTQTGTVTNFLAVASDGSVIETASTNGSMVVINDADHTVASNESAIRYHNAISATRTLTLPSAASFPNREIWVRTNTINGGASLVISSVSTIYINGTSGSTSPSTNVSFISFLFKSDGTSWYAIN